MQPSLASLLKTHDIQPTKQRLEVAAALLSRPCHRSAEQILAELKAAGSGVSKATVYNTLALFCDKGLVQTVNVDSSRIFYDSTTEPHHHFFNVDSGELHDIPAEQVELCNLPALPRGTQPQGIEVIVRIRNQR